MASRPCLSKHPEPVLSGCHHCSLFLHDSRYRALWSGESAPDGQASTGRLGRARCGHLGSETGETRACVTCGERGKPVAIHNCAVHGTCTTERQTSGLQTCRTCESWIPAVSIMESVEIRRAAALQRHAKERAAKHVEPPPSFVKRIDHISHWNAWPGKRFNSSMIRWGEGYLFAYRHGWRGSEIFLGLLDANFNPLGEPWRLDLHHRVEANFGREDVRLFWYRRRLHVSYIGVKGASRLVRTSQLYARLTDDLRVDRVFYPHYEGRQAWEKNWAFFEADGDLYAVYSFSPHKILRVIDDTAELAFEAPTVAQWDPETEIRGGASPVRIGDEFWHFAHSRWEKPAKRYMTLLYTFETESPFRVRRIIPAPILVADPRTNVGEDPNYCPVVFPCGAEPIYRDDGTVSHWLVTHGIHDRYTEIHRWDHADLESRLIPVRTGYRQRRVIEPMGEYI